MLKEFLGVVQKVRESVSTSRIREGVCVTTLSVLGRSLL
jgi:hypothetical protein